jgi:hypothetical protein
VIWEAKVSNGIASVQPTSHDASRSIIIHLSMLSEAIVLG